MSIHFDSDSKVSVSPEEFVRRTGVDEAICDSLKQYAVLLKKWQKRFNLVGPSTLNDLWGRHFLDSAQLRPLVSQASGGSGVIVDLGSGAGFPGLVLSIMGAGEVHLIESDANKTEFMRHVIRETGATAVLHRTRIESYDGPRPATVTSRACAPLGKLLGYAEAVGADDARLLFLKGRNWQAELTESLTVWHIEHRCHISRTDPEGVILEINEFYRR